MRQDFLDTGLRCLALLLCILEKIENLRTKHIYEPFLMMYEELHGTSQYLRMFAIITPTVI